MKRIMKGRYARKKTKRFIRTKHIIQLCLLFCVMFICYVTKHVHTNFNQDYENDSDLVVFQTGVKNSAIKMEPGKKNGIVDHEHNPMPSSIIHHERESQALEEKTNLYHGRVLTELCSRILLRNIAQSNVLIVSPDIIEEEKIMPKKNESDFKMNILGPSKVVVKHSVDEGHTVHLLPISTDLNTWVEKSSETKWFLMTYFVPGNSPSESIDIILHPDRVKKLFSETTMTYIIIAIKSNVSTNTGNEIEMDGLTAAQTLLNSDFKVQLLASSHFFGVHPNHLFKDRSDIEAFLSSGASFSQTGSFDALLFATQGLDLAIPSRQSYIQLDTLCGNICGNILGRCDSKLDARALGDDIFISCPQRHETISIDFDDSFSKDVRITLNGNVVDDVNGEDFELWFGQKDPKSSEAACVRKRGIDINSDKVSCTTRILRNPPSSPHISDKKEKEGFPTRPKSRYNFLSILIDPISRFQFQRSLPNTALLLKTLNFTSFEQYTAVGDNSGPNQCALFTGYPLSGGRDGITNSESHTKSNAKLWLWDLFNARGFVTLKTEDICIKNSNMVQSMKPKTTHGEQLFEMFCFDFDRPNCLGKDLMAKHVVDYAKKFMKSYGKSNVHEAQPWAAFLSFVDSHEDTLTLISYIDELLVDFLQSIDLSSTIVVLSSDHGLHYGPSFASNGELERAQPTLYLHIPQQMGLSHILKKNRLLYTTPFDVHETILDAAALNYEREGIIGSSLLKPMPNTRNNCRDTPGIPEKFCNLFDGKERYYSDIDVRARKKPLKEELCTLMHEPPSINSFYADIPRKNRPSWPKCKKENVSNLSAEERQAIEITINIKTKQELVEKYKEKKSQIYGSATEIEEMPNILFLEIDSVSHSTALRHLPKTIAMLRSHQIMFSAEEGAHCPSGFCAAMFGKTSIVGQNSIPNQLAALSGCQEYNSTRHESYQREPIKTSPRVFSTFCPIDDVENPLLFDIVEKLGYVTFFGEEFCYSDSPYVIQGNHFELKANYDMNKLFCKLAEAEKRNHDKFQPKDDSEIPTLCQIEYDTSKNPQPCVDGRSRQEFAFEYIRGIWDAYPDVPKFAFLNSLPAHDYSIDTAYRQLGLEAYDDYLSDFLGEMLGRPDAKKTVIVLRSDHGVQGGPAPIDYSNQVEHMNPFNSLIVPENLRGLSLSNLFSNQERLVTGFDLYHTLREILKPSPKKPGSMRKRESNGLKGYSSTWTYNLLGTEVPKGRNCRDAEIPMQLCPCVQERFDLMPYFYVGYSEYLGVWKDAKLKYNTSKRMFEPQLLSGRSI